jgi:hypothetical protein
VPFREARDFVWTPPVAYAIGLIATDGNLSRDGRHISVVSKDLDQLETLRRCLGLRVSVSEFQSTRGRLAGRVQWSDRTFYKVLLTIGLTPNKSLTIGRLAIPDDYYPDFFRGCIDGDGSVLVYIDRHHTAKNERYVYKRLYVSLACASRPFVEWIQSTVQRLTSLHGVIEIQLRKGRRPIWPALRKAGVRRSPSLDVLRSRPALSGAQTGQGRAIPPGGCARMMRAIRAGVEKLANSRRSKRRARKGLGVRLPSPAPTHSLTSFRAPL